MADKTIGSLPQAPVLTDDSSFVCEDSGVAKRVTGKQFKDFAKEGAAPAVEAAENAADRAEAATVNAPKIKDGTWWTFDQDTQTYVDTGVEAQGPQGNDGKKGDTGSPGPKGDPFTYADFTPAQLESLRGPAGQDGADGKDGLPGKDGSDGATPTIGENGNWYLKGTDTGKPSRGENGKDGQPGEKGESGVYYGTEEPGEEYDVWIDPNGEAASVISDVKVDGQSVVTDGVANIRLTDIRTAMDEVAVAGAQYYLGEQTAVSVVLPDDAPVGKMITVSWYNGSTAATLSITGTMLGFDYTPGANSRSEVNCLWDGTYWAILSNEMEVSSE